MTKSDGSVIIDTKLNTGGFEKAANGITHTFSIESQKIEGILSDTNKSMKAKAASIAAIYKKQGLTQSEAFKKAWDQIERASGSASKEVKKDIRGIGAESKRIAAETSGSLKSQFGSLASAAGKLGKAAAAAFSVKALIDFGKAAVNLGSDLQEVQNVVDVTFSTMNEQINEFAKNAAKTAGLSETMAKKYAGTFGAMSKSFGFTEQEAYGMSTALTQLTGDVASFYNLTQDEAYTKLKSVFTGETESLKDLGVVMTQTALDDFALRKGLGKTTDQMSEQEKVALRYQFVMEQLSGASGDFVRTQDGWANQTRILKLQTESLMATMGQGLINALTPALKVLNTMIGKLQEFAEVFKQVTEVLFGNASGNSGGVAGSLGSAAENAEELKDNITDAGKAAKKALAGFDEINVLTQKTEESTGGIESVLGSVSGTPTQGGGAANSEGAIAAGANKLVSDLLDIKDKLQELAAPLKNFDLKALADSVKKCKNALGKLGSTISDKLEDVWFDVLVPLGKWAIEKGLPTLIDTLSDSFYAVGSVVDYFWPVLQEFWNDFLKPLAKWTGDAVIGGLGLLGDALEAIGKHFDLSVPKAYELSAAEKEIESNAKLAAAELGRLQKQSEDAETAIDNQYKKVELLAEELLLLADGSGKVKDADKDRAGYILGELNKALGTEYTMVGNIIQRYGDLKSEIYSLISAKKANALLDANTETYQKALLSQDDAYAAMKSNEKAYKEQEELASRHIESYQKQIAILQNKIDTDVARYGPFGSEERVDAYNTKIGEITDKIKEQESTLEEVRTAYQESVARYQNIFSIISEYDKATALIATGNYDEAVGILAGYASRHSGVAEKIEDQLKLAATSAGYYAQRILEEFENGTTDVTKEAVKAAVGAYDEAIEELEKIDPEGAKEIGLNFAELFAQGIRDSSDVIYGALNDVLGGAKVPITFGIAAFGSKNIPLPHLAKGTVIPPNAPFMAVLGDQRHGTNVEAPLDTIKQALAEVLAMQGSGGETNVNVTFTGDLAQLARILKPEIDTETRRRGGSLATGGAY